MKKILALLTLAVMVSTNASETCNAGYTCELVANNEVVLRDVRSFNDEGLDFCETITIKNFGSNQIQCQKAADLLNAQPYRN